MTIRSAHPDLETRARRFTCPYCGVHRGPCRTAGGQPAARVHVSRWRRAARAAGILISTWTPDGCL